MTTSTWNRTPIFIVVAVLIGVVTFIGWFRESDSVPRLNADTVTIANFVASDAYLKMPFDKQALFMKVLEDREDNGELKRAFSSGRLSEASYRAAIQEAWLGEQLKRAEKYAVLAPGPNRTRFIVDLLDRKQKQPKPESGKASGGSGADDDRDDVDLVKRDPSATQLRVQSWPAPVRTQFEAYRQAYDDARQAREEAAKPQPATPQPPVEGA